jgi:hypothetical protein
MNTLEEFIRNSIDLLQNKDISSINFSRPFYPTCVFYFGNQSNLYHRELKEDIQQGWGRSTDFISFYSIEDADTLIITDMISGSIVTVDQIRKQITNTLTAQDVFENMTQLALYCIIDTTYISTEEEFRSWYFMYNHVKETLGVATLSMLMVILNESLQYTSLSQGVKKKILDFYLDPNVGGVNQHLYNAVFVFGNRLKNGAFVKVNPTESEYSNYNLFADVILLTNTRGEDYSLRKERLYGRDKPALTAAYGYVQKPMEEIVMITLGIVLKNLKSLIPKQSFNDETLRKALKIDRSTSEIYEQFYADIKGMLPSNEFLQWLPGKAGTDSTFDELNKASSGCLQVYLEQNHVAIMEDELRNRNEYITAEVLHYLEEEFTAAQLINGVSFEIRQSIYDKAEIAYATPGQFTVEIGIELTVKKIIASALRKQIDQVLTEAIQKAATCMELFGQLCTEHDKRSAIGEEGSRRNLIAFYGERLQRYYNDQRKLNSLFSKVLKIRNTKSEMLQILLKEIETIFTGDEVYRYSFSKELVERLGSGDTKTRAQEFIGQELIKNLEDKVAFYSKHVYPSKMFEAYLLNTEGNSDNLLYEFLKNRDIPREVSRTFFNTSNNNMAESIWFYVCNVDNLML